jgi:hypothetical protein
MMKPSHRIAVALTLGIAVISLTPLAQAQTDRYEALANSAMVENRPTPETSKLLKDELLFQRATNFWSVTLYEAEAVVWQSHRASSTTSPPSAPGIPGSGSFRSTSWWARC